jgi:outer membrane lipoprotein-sorting protein
MTGQTRDEVLGAALRRLEVPEHRPGFEAALRERLVEQVARERPRARRHAPGPARRPAFRRGPWALGLAAAAIVALAVLVVTSTLPGSRPGIATAAEVRQAVARAWASAQSVRGVLVSRAPRVFEEGRQRWSFILTAEGDFRMENLTRGGTVVYDAATGVERSLDPSESIPDIGALFASERRGLAPGPPDPAPRNTLLDRGLGGVVRSLAAGGGGTVTEITYDGRPAWLLDTDIRANLIVPELSPNHLRVTVDRETGFPVRVVATRDGEFVRETRIEDLTLNGPVPPNAFRLEFPPDSEVFREDVGFRRVELDELEAVVGYDPLVPAWMPDGYGPAELTASRKGSFTGAEGANPPVGDVVSLSFRRGLDQFIVTTRPVGPDPSLWGDPLASGEGFRDEPERIRLEAGALAGEAANLLIDPLAIPHVWAMTGDLVVTVSGDLTRDELLRVAESLR